MIEKIKKRNGIIVNFDINKISNAINKAFKSVDYKIEKENFDNILQKIVLEIEKQYNNSIPNVENVQDIIEKVLIKLNYSDIAKSYILYRDQHTHLREGKYLFKEAMKHIDEYINRVDWKVNENSNMDYSLQGLNNHISSLITSEFWLNRIYPPEISNLHKNCDFHIHDLGLLAVYCCGWDLKDLIIKGFTGVTGKVQSKPPKHFKSVLGQIVNFIYTLQGECAGAQALSSFDTLLAPFVFYDNLSYDEVEKCIEEFVFNLNIPTRVGFQTPFSNLTFDLQVNNNYKNNPVIIGDKYLLRRKYKLNTVYSDFIYCYYLVDFNYNLKNQKLINEYNNKSSKQKQIENETQIVDFNKSNKFKIISDRKNNEQRFDNNIENINDYINDAILISEELLLYDNFQHEMIIINKAFCNVMINGDKLGRIFSFPIPTYNITKDFDWSNSEYEYIWEMTSKYGIPSFANYINSDMKPEDATSMCCRLRLDHTELQKRGGGLFGANPLTGSIGVVTINLPRIGYLAKNKEDYLDRLYYLMDYAKNSLEIKRKVLEKLTNDGLYPYSKFYLDNVHQRFGKYWSNHFSTIGIIGMNESCINFLKKDITTDEGKLFAIEILNFIRDTMKEFQDETSNLYNLEATPAEATTYRLAKYDKMKYPDIFTQGKNEPYYTNSTHLPVNYTNDIYDVLKHQDEIQSLYTGGTVLHIFIGEKIDDYKVTKNVVKKISENFKLPYFTLSPTFTICPIHGYIKGEHYNCPHNI